MSFSSFPAGYCFSVGLVLNIGIADIHWFLSPTPVFFFFSDKYPFFLQNATLPFCGNAVNDSILVSCPLSDWGWIVWSKLVQSKFFFHQDFWVLREVTRNYRNWVLIVVSQGNHRNYVKTSPKMPWFLLSRPDYPDFPWFLRPPCTFIRFLSNKVGCFFVCFVLFCL